MIKNLTAGSGLQIMNSYNTWPSFYQAPSSANSLVGQMRYNGSNQNMEVYDGSSWMTINSTYPQIELAPHVQAVVNWAQSKMAEESRLRELAAKHPAVADAMEAVKKAEQQLRVVSTLVNAE